MNDLKKETTILQEGNVRVTDQRVLIGTDSYAVSNIKSVNLTRQERSKRPLLLIPLGMLLALWAIVTDAQFMEFFNIGIALVIAGLVIFLILQPFYTIHFENGSGQVGIMNITNPALTKRIVAAINTAIAGNKTMESIHK